MPFLTDFLKGKSIYPPIRRFLKIVFTASVASFIFEKYYYHYTLLSITDYKSIYTFLVSGRFFIPLFIFAVVNIFMGIVAEILFNLLTTPFSTKIIFRIVNKKISKRSITATVKRIRRTRVFGEKNKLSVPILVQYYQLLKSNIKKEELLRAQSLLKEKKLEISRNFKLCIRAILATIVYYITLKEFSGWAFIISIILISLVSLLFVCAYILLDIIPVALKKVNSVAEEYIAESERQSSQV